MNANLINPFLSAISEVLPQLGFREIRRGNLRLSEQTIISKGLTVVVGLTKQVKGNVAYNMSVKTAIKFASTMMMGMAVSNLDEMAQSAISELINMITANAAIQLEKQGVIVDISPPAVIIGEATTARLGTSRNMVLEMFIDSELVEVNIGLDT